MLTELLLYGIAILALQFAIVYAIRALLQGVYYVSNSALQAKRNYRHSDEA